MRDNIDFGIDLGTTNSAIAVVEDDAVCVIKNNDGWDITPSAVAMPKPGTVLVGRTARERVESEPDDAAAEFKLEMGLADARRNFARAGVSLSPPQLSAEVLKSLRADAAHHCGEQPDAVVITVPAAFTLNQNQATTEAARLAGFTAACPLVQEPTAAAFAYGFHAKADRAYWMVFDFGGGTFDAAVVSKRDGDLRVLDHAGDPYLGGKLIDWAIVEWVLAPAVVRDLGLREFRRDNPSWRGNFAVLKATAEATKIQLSRREQVEIMVPILDAHGKTVTFEYTMRRGELDAIAEPHFARAVNLCRNALREASLTPDDIDRLLLVGGVTLMPGLRERLADSDDGLGIELDLSLDPTTVVARGAAIFASTVRRPKTPSAAVAPGQFTLDLSYEASVNTTRPTVAGRVGGSATDWTTYAVTLANPQGRPPFRSARIALNAAGAFVTEVDIDEHRTSRFTVELSDAVGTRCPLAPESLSITHRDVEFGGMRLAHSMGIQLADRAFAPMLRRGATLPTRAREVFRTSRALHRSDPEAVIRIPVLSGERSRGDRNREVGMLEIRPRDVRIDLPAGSDVEITFEADESSLVTVVADVPLVEATFEAEISPDDVRTPTVAGLQATLAETEERLATLRGTGSASPDAERRLAELDEEGTLVTAREQVRAAAVDDGAAASAEERLRDVQAELDDVEDAVALPGLIQQLQGILTDAADLVERGGTAADREELAELRRREQDAVQAQDPIVVHTQIDRAGALVIELERRSPDWPVKLFYLLKDMLGTAGPAGALVRDGERAIGARDQRGLEAVNERLIRLLPTEEQEKIGGVTRI